MQTMCADFGCEEHWYEADGYFAAGRPPWYQEQTHAAHFAAAGASTTLVEPNPNLNPNLNLKLKLKLKLNITSSSASAKCCCGTAQCSAPAKPSCCSCCPPSPLDPAVVANARLHATAAYTGLNRTDPDAIWYYQGWILGGYDALRATNTFP
jgi:hypothetical protein